MNLDPSAVRWDWSPSGILAWLWACPGCGRPCESSDEGTWSAQQVAADPLCASCKADQVQAPAPRKISRPGRWRKSPMCTFCDEAGNYIGGSSRINWPCGRDQAQLSLFGA